MEQLRLHDFHARSEAQFAECSGLEVVAEYGDLRREYELLREGAGALDLSARGRLCVLGKDRQTFLHGQVTNDVKALKAGEGCYAALITAKGKMISDLNIYQLENELLLDFEPGLTGKVQDRLDQFVIADDVEIVDVSPHYGLLSIQGPKAAEVVHQLGLGTPLPTQPFTFATYSSSAWGEVYVINQPRLHTTGFDLFVPNDALLNAAETLQKALEKTGGRFCGLQAFEVLRIESGIPRFGADMDETNLPPEAGLEARAISYSKGCYIGQEVISRIRAFGQVAKTLRKLRFASGAESLPRRGDKLFKDGKEVGFVTSAIFSPAQQANVGLGYVRREANSAGTELMLHEGTKRNSVVVMG